VLPHLVALCPKLSQEDKAFLITQIGPAIAAILGNNLSQRQEFALSALAILGDRMHAYGTYWLADRNWKEGLAACSCGWETNVIDFLEHQDQDFLGMEPVSIASWDGKSMDNEPVLLQRLGDEKIIRVLPWIYGTCACPDCGKREAYWTWLVR
ncbi:MAG: hypothetical protein K2H91_03005, partial [Lachnospiraceae bacterium]|nr:hypothetical protein [Lachnospiraceae bacterium]